MSEKFSAGRREPSRWFHPLLFMSHREATHSLKVTQHISAEPALERGSGVLSSILTTVLGLRTFIPISEIGKLGQRGKTVDSSPPAVPLRTPRPQ